MRNTQRIGISKVFRLTFLLVFIFLVIILLAKSCFDNTANMSEKEEIPILISDTKYIQENGKIDVNQERYYYDLGLLPPRELPDIYTISSSSSINDENEEANLFIDKITKDNFSSSLFNDIEFDINRESINSKINKALEEKFPKTELKNNNTDEQLQEINDIFETDNYIENDESIIDFEDKIESVDDNQGLNLGFVQTDFDDDQEFVEEEAIFEDDTKDVIDDTFEDDFFDTDFEDDFFFEDDFADDFFFDGGFVGDLGIPFEPLIFAPYIQTQEEFDLFNVTEEESNEFDDDFFDDFYIAGESDEALFEDGIYFLTLFVNDELVGDVETKLEGSVYSIGANSLEENVSGLLSDYGNQRLFNRGVEYYTIEELNELGIEAEIDVVAFEVYLVFGVDDMPLRYLPVAQVEKNTLIERNEKYGISDALVLKQDFISGISTLNLTGSYSYGSAISNPYFNTTLNINNSINVGSVAFSFANSLRYYADSTQSLFEYDATDWNGTYYIRDDNLKITFGNVGSSLGTNGTPVGFTVEKNYSYGTGEPLSHQYTRRYTLESDSLMYIYINEEDEVIKKLRKGEYILQDFPLDQGANHIKVKIVPDDINYPIQLDEFNIPYDTRLLSLGDYLYGFSAAISKSEREDDSTNFFRLPYLDAKWYDYDFTDFDTKFFLNVGLSHYFTLNSSFAYGSKQFKATFDGILATMSGPFTGSLSFDFTREYTPIVQASISHNLDTIIGDVSTSMLLNLPVWDASDNSLETPSSLEINLGHSLDIENYPPLNTNIKAGISNEGLDFSTTFSSNYAPLPGVSLSSTFTMKKNAGSSDLDFTLQLGLGFSLHNDYNTSTSVSSSGSASHSISYKPTNFDSIQFNLGGIQYFDSTQPTISAYWQHVGSFYSTFIRHNISKNFTTYDTSASLSTSVFHSGGLFAIDQNVSSNFLIIRPEGEFKNNPISIGKTNSSDLDELNPIFGNVVYTKLGANQKNNLIAYGSTESLYSSGASFSYELYPSTSSGFSARISSPISYTVSGVLYMSDGTPHVQYSSPVYNIKVDDNGVEYIETNEDLYLFTDLDGRFILSDVKEGTYLFDMATDNNRWYGLYFVIEDTGDLDKKVVLLEDYQVVASDDISLAFDIEEDEGASSENVFGDSFASDYVDIVKLNIDKYEKEQTFWDTIFPPLEEESFDDFAFADTASDWQDSLIDDDFEDDFVFDDTAFIDTAEDWQEALGEELVETVVDETNNLNPNYTYVP